MKSSDRYLKLVEWSDEDGCYVGRCPELMLGGVHGSDGVIRIFGAGFWTKGKRIYEQANQIHARSDQPREDRR